MAVEYDLRKNHLNNGKPFTASVHATEHLTMEEIEERMQESGSLTTDIDISAVLKEFFKVIKSETKMGHRLITPFFTTDFSITGGFETASDSFDPEVNQLHVNINASSSLREIVKTMTPVRKKLASNVLEILGVLDSVTGSSNDVITSNGVIKVSGSMVKLEGDDARICFVAEDGSEINCPTVVTNNPKEVTAMSPDLEAGLYHLKIVTRYGGGVVLKTAKEYTLEDDLHVV